MVGGYKSKAQLEAQDNQANVIGQVDTLVQMIERFENQIKKALPEHITPARMSRMIITEVRNKPDLALCDRASFFSAILHCARLGLEPGGGLGYIYLIPRNNKNLGIKEVQVITGYQGMTDLVERDGRCTLDAHVIYKKDKFRYKLGLKPELEHEPYFGDEDPGEVVGAYAVADYGDGRTKFRVLTRYEIEKARAYSENGDSKYSPWQKEYGEMARKTAVRRLFKMVPKNPDNPALLKTLELEQALDKGQSQHGLLECPQEILDQIAANKKNRGGVTVIERGQDGAPKNE